MMSTMKLVSDKHSNWLSYIIPMIFQHKSYSFAKVFNKLGPPLHVWLFSHGIPYFFLSSFPSCLSPKDSITLIISAQLGGGSTCCCSHVFSITERQFCEFCGWSAAMVSSVPFGIPRRIPILIHLSAMLLRVPVKSFSSGMVECPLDSEA